jgi:hypothetical protein
LLLFSTDVDEALVASEVVDDVPIRDEDEVEEREGGRKSLDPFIL